MGVRATGPRAAGWCRALLRLSCLAAPAVRCALDCGILRGQMSHRDPEVVAEVRRALDAYSRGDFEAAMRNVHPEIELVPAGGQQTLKGASRFRVWMEPDAFESQVIEPLDVRVAGNRVLIRTRTHIKGAGSGIEADFLGWGVWTYDETGLVTRVEIFLDHERAEALAAAGLSEEDARADT